MRRIAALRPLEWVPSPDPVTAALLLAGARWLADPPPGFCDRPLIDPCGLLLVPDPRADWAPSAEHGARRVSRRERERLAPHFRPPDGGPAWFLPAQGRLDVAALMEAFARGARAGGASLRTGAEVEALLAGDGAVRGVRLAGGEELRADTTVLAAGGWAGALGRRAGSEVRLTPTRRHLLVTAFPRGGPAVDPRWPVVWDDGWGFYARPESGGLLLCACDQTEVDPDDCRADPAVRETVAEKAARLLPDFAAAGAAHFWCGLRTFAADGRFAVGPDPALRGLFWVAGLGGHGMGASAAVGRLAAERLVGGPPRGALGRALDPGRLVPARAGGRS